MEAVVNARTADELASVLQRSGSNLHILQATIAGVIPISMGAGACLTLSLLFLSRSRERGVYQILLCAIGVLSLASCIVLAVDLGYLSSHLDSMANAYRTDNLCIISTFFLTALAAHLSRLLFIHRAYILVGRRRLLMVPLLGTAHVALGLQVGLDIYGFLQPQWGAETAGADLGRVKQWFGGLLAVRSKLQVVWAMVSLVCDLMICMTIIVSLLRLRTFFDRTRGVINRLAVMVTQTMLPPMVLSAIYAGVILSGTQGPGSWFRSIAAFQAVFYWFAVVWTLRTRKRFLQMLDPPRPIPNGPAPPLYTFSDSRPPTPHAPGHTSAGCTALSCTLVHDGPAEDKGRSVESRMDVEVKRPSRAGFYDEAEEGHIMTIDEALQGPDLLYSDTEGKEGATRGLNIMV